ncbi:MAG TPA: succinate dehydrogenase cytochrome b subunit [Opitutaceae bacterium]
MSLLGNLFRSSIGRKFLMAASGLILVGFVIGHLVGNLQIFSHPDKINGYAQFLHDLGPLLWVARIGLIVAVIIHVWMAVALTLENRKARGANDYGVKNTIQATLASRTMRWTGFVVLAFIVYHLAHFTLGGAQAATFKSNLPLYTLQNDYYVAGFPVVKAGAEVLDVHSMVIYGFKNALVSVFYIIAVGLLSFHLVHGADSMFQTLGWRSYKWAGALRKAVVVLCVAYFLANLAIPASVLLGKVSLRSDVTASATLSR